MTRKEYQIRISIIRTTLSKIDAELALKNELIDGYSGYRGMCWIEKIKLESELEVLSGLIND